MFLWDLFERARDFCAMAASANSGVSAGKAEGVDDKVYGDKRLIYRKDAARRTLAINKT